MADMTTWEEVGTLRWDGKVISTELVSCLVDAAPLRDKDFDTPRTGNIGLKGARGRLRASDQLPRSPFRRVHESCGSEFLDIYLLQRHPPPWAVLRTTLPRRLFAVSGDLSLAWSDADANRPARRALARHAPPPVLFQWKNTGMQFLL
jgi:hypothetical protein